MFATGLSNFSPMTRASRNNLGGFARHALSTRKNLQGELKKKQNISRRQAALTAATSTTCPLKRRIRHLQRRAEIHKITTPCLAIFAVPHDTALPTDPAHQAAAAAFELKRSTDMSNAFAAGIPAAKVIRLPKANHYVIRSNESPGLTRHERLSRHATATLT